MTTRSETNDFRLDRYSFGVGDRFARQGKAQLRACVLAARRGVRVDPVWNKSNREHLTVGSEPSQVREEADEAVRDLGWTGAYYVDADHITWDTAHRFLESSDFFTLDVAAEIGRSPGMGDAAGFAARHPELLECMELPGLGEPLQIGHDELTASAEKYLLGVREAARLYRRIESVKGAGRFITEVSMDETEFPQTPAEMLVILAALAEEEVPLQTIAPKFTGRFNKGVDYAGIPEQFEAEFRTDIAVIGHAVLRYGLPENLKLSIHSGSDKFTLYPMMRSAMLETGAGIHIKTAGTTWLEEVAGLAEAGGEGLALAKEIYSAAYAHCEELCEPYAAVIDIDSARLPRPGEVNAWSPEEYTAALRHDEGCPAFNPHLRQLLHVGYKVAAKMGTRFYSMLDACAETIERNVTTNLFERHISRLFL